MRHVGSGAAPKQSIGHQKPVNKFHFQDNSCCQYLLHAFEIRGARIAFDSKFSVLCRLLFKSCRCRTVVETPAPICSSILATACSHTCRSMPEGMYCSGHTSLVLPYDCDPRNIYTLA